MNYVTANCEDWLLDYIPVKTGCLNRLGRRRWFVELCAKTMPGFLSSPVLMYFRFLEALSLAHLASLY